jgi:hypothetical protein
VAGAVQADKLGGLPKSASARVMELRDALPHAWREVFAGVSRVHVTRTHRIERRQLAGRMCVRSGEVSRQQRKSRHAQDADE